MKVIDPGHTYALDSLDGDESQVLNFVKRVGNIYPGNENAHPGTTIQEVCRALIDRVKHIDGQNEHWVNPLIISYLRSIIRLCEKRAYERHNRVFTGDVVIVNAIELLPTNSHGHLWRE